MSNAPACSNSAALARSDMLAFLQMIFWRRQFEIEATSPMNQHDPA